jgi:hypothetical protein
MSKFQSISLPTLSDSATMKEVENESRKMGLDILNKLNSVADAQYPVGYVYTQYSGQTAPALLFGGTWTDITFTSLPTQIYDSGSNANGSWIRYTDGTMQCWASGIVLGVPVDTGAGSYPGLTGFFDRYYATSNWVYPVPVPFMSAPTVTANHAGSYHDSFGGVSYPSFTTTTQTALIAGCGRIAGLQAPENTMTAQAWGKWSSAPVYPVTLWKRTGGSLTTTTGTSVVTGIYDSGTNSNGSWIRFTDGTMQCWAHIPLTSRTLTRATLVSGIGWYEITLPTITFPIPFISQPSITVGGYGGTGNIETIQPYNVTSTTMLYAYEYLGPDAGATTSVSFESDWVATGKWK